LADPLGELRAPPDLLAAVGGPLLRGKDGREGRGREIRERTYKGKGGKERGTKMRERGGSEGADCCWGIDAPGVDL